MTTPSFSAQNRTLGGRAFLASFDLSGQQSSRLVGRRPVTPERREPNDWQRVSRDVVAGFEVAKASTGTKRV